MDKKKKILIVAIVLVLILAGLGAVIVLAGENDTKPVKTATTEQTTTDAISTEESTTEAVKEEPTTEVIAEEEPTTETEVAEATTESPVKPESTEAPTQSATTEAPAPTQTEAPSTTEEPKPEPTTEAHVHDWYWVVDQEAWTETVEHPETTTTVTEAYCHYCGQGFANGTEANAHSEYYAIIGDLEHGVAGWGQRPKEVIVPAWTEEIPHEEVGHYECSCGARK